MTALFADIRGTLVPDHEQARPLLKVRRRLTAIVTMLAGAVIGAERIPHTPYLLSAGSLRVPRSAWAR